MIDADPAEHDSLLGARIDGRYSVLQELGRGGMGIVYEGVHDELGRSVAIKVLNLAWATDPTAVARFLREARVASSFSHPNIVDVSDLGRLPDGRPYLVMPKIVGTDLTALLAESGAQPAKRVAHLLSGVAAALDLIHARGFVHRDIKPENLMYVVRDDGLETVMLLDFGIAAAVMSNEPRLTGQGAIFGTPQFMPPEVCNGGMPDARGDVYALTTVAFELITGDLPFGGDNMMHVLTSKLTRDAPSLGEIGGVAFPQELEAVIARGLARDPVRRFPRASEFVSALKAATDHAPVSWKSGVLRPSIESAAYPVGSRPVGQRTRTGRSRSQPITSQPEVVEEWQRRASSRPPPSASEPYRPRSQPTPANEYAHSNRPRSDRSAANPHDHTQPAAAPRPRSDRSPAPPPDYAHEPPEYAADGGYHPRQPRIAPRLTEDDDYGPGHLGSSRGSDRQRQPASVAGRRSGGGRAVLLLGCLALLLGVLWLRDGETGSNVLDDLGLSRTTPPGAAPATTDTPTARVEPAPPSAATPAPPSATQPATPQAAPTAPPIAPATPPVTVSPQAQAPTPAAPISPPSAATPQAARPATPSAPGAALKTPLAVPAVRPTAPPKSSPAIEPPAPEHTGENESAETQALNESSGPVFKVAEEQPVDPEPDEPELPVRPPEAQAAQLTREATSALLAGEVSRAVELLETATRQDPTHALAWRTLGLAQERSGNVREALNAYQQYIQLAPHGAQSDMVRERMRVLEQ